MAERAFVDTNIFLRYLTNDIPRQADAAEALFRKAEAGEIRLTASQMVIAEIVWTLESYYRFPKDAIRQHILALLNTPGIEVENESLISQAVDLYTEHNIDFLDAYNALWRQAAGLRIAYTFDLRHFSRLPFVEAKQP